MYYAHSGCGGWKQPKSCQTSSSSRAFRSVIRRELRASFAQKSCHFPVMASTLFNALQHTSTFPIRAGQITGKHHRQVARAERVKTKFWGMTPTPPWAGGEAARCRAQWLLAPTAPRESCAVRRRAVAPLDTEPQAERRPGARKGEMKFDEQSSGL